MTRKIACYHPPSPKYYCILYGMKVDQSNEFMENNTKNRRKLIARYGAREKGVGMTPLEGCWPCYHWKNVGHDSVGHDTIGRVLVMTPLEECWS